MEAQSMALRHAIQLLYSASNRSDQQRADTWLQDFRNQGEAYILCLELLLSPTVSEPEAYFAANTLRYACSRSSQLIAPEVAAQLIPKIVICLFDAYSKSKWTVASQLSSALAVLMVRMPSWSAHSMIIDLEKLLISQLAQYLQLVQQQQSSVAHLTTLHVLAALPAACNDKHCSVAPNRRLVVSEALASSPHIHPWIQTAFLAYEQHQVPQMQHLYLNLGMQLIHGWCELGCLPILLPQHLSILQHVCRAALSQETAGTGAETLVSIITVIKDVTTQGSDLLLLTVQCWQEALAQLTVEAQQRAAISHEVLQSMCLVLCAIASALLPFALGADNQLKTEFIRVAEQLMAHLTSTDDEVALTALEYWQDTYLTTLQGLPNAARQVAIASHTQLLQALTAGLVLRSQLDYKTAVKATADARDLPEEVRLVRRELAQALRDITSLVGLGSMSQYLAALVQVQWAAFTEASRMPGQNNPTCWTALECMLYAANVVLGQSGQAKRREPPSSVAVQLLVEICVACIMQAEDPAAAPKLLGTALTLLGGLGTWFMEQPDAFRSVLNALTVALKSPNDKLARNAATTVYRLCQNKPVAAQVLIQHGTWVEGLLQHYQATGGVHKRIGSGSDLTTEELLLATLCKLAMQPASSSLAFGGNLLLHLTQPKLQELRQTLSNLVNCSAMALNLLANTTMTGSEVMSKGTATGGGGVTTQSQALQQATQQAQVQAIQQAAQQAQALQQAAQQAQAQQGQAQVAQPASPTLGQPDTSNVNDFAQALALAGQAGACLEVLNMAVENATTTPKMKELLGTLSTATSVSESPHGGPEREYMGGGYPGGNSLQPSMSVESRGSMSDMSRTPSFTGPAMSTNGGAVMTQAECVCAEQVLTLVRSVWSILQACLTQVQSLPLVTGPACDMFTCALRNLPPGFQQEVHVLSIQLLACLPPRVLTSPKCLTLLSAVLDVFGARPGSPNNTQQLRAEAAAAAANTANGSASSPSRSPPTINLQTLLTVSQSAVLHSCQQVMGSCDPDLIIPVLLLCRTVLERLPVTFTNASTVDAVLSMTRATARSYDIEQCKVWLDWVLQLMSAPFIGTARPRPSFQSGMVGVGVAAANLSLALNRNMQYAGMMPGMVPQPVVSSNSGAAQGLLTPGPSQEGLELLALQLEGSTGPQIMLALLLAASGDMPPDLVQTVGSVVFQIWSAVGTKLFSPWIEKAVLELGKEYDVGWAKQRHDVKLAALQELVCQETECDMGRFKKLFKSFCRGKKSAGMGSLPNSRNLSRQSSFLSASNHVNV